MPLQAAPPAEPPAAPPPAAPAPEAPAPEAPPPAAPPGDEASPPAAPDTPTDASPSESQPPAAPPPVSVEESSAGVPQTPVEGGVPEAADEPYYDTEEEVIKVTVDRREKNLQDYSGSATALGEQDLKRLGVSSVRNMSSTTPYVELGVQEGNTEVFIRGVGSTNNTELGDPAVSTHIDGVYIPRPRGVGSMVFDIQRVEVNRGPQGTVRGRNAIGGSLNIVTNKPKLGTLEASASVGVGNYSQKIGDAMVNIPIGETLALRLAAFTEVHDPHYENAGPIHTLKASDSADTIAYRASLRWDPFKALTINIMHDFTQEGGTGYSGSNFNDALAAGILPEEVPNPRAVWYRGAQAELDMQHWGIMGDIGVDLGAVNIEYLGSYRNLDYRQITAGNAGVDFRGKPMPDLDNWGTSYWHTRSESVVQELRIFAPDDARFRWTVGGFFFNEEQQGFLGTTSDKSTGFFGVEFTMPDMHSDAWAGYADGTFDITDAIRAIGGIRITTEKKERHGIGHVYSFNGISDLQRFGTEGFRYAEWDRTNYGAPPPGGVPDAPFDEFRNGIAQYGVRDTLDAALDQPGVTAGGSWNVQSGKSKDTYLDFRLGAELDVTPEHLLYVTFTTGHKSGGFNDNITVTNPDTMQVSTLAPTYDPETLYATEIGSKNELADGKIIVNASAFWYQYKDQQFQSIVEILPPEGTTSDAVAPSAVRYNAASSRILGLEADLKWRLPVGFEANVQASLLDARFTEGVVADTRVGFGANDQPKVNLEGNRMMRAPVFAINYALGQTIDTSVGYFDWLINAQTKTKQYMTVFNGEGRDTNGNVNPVLSDVVPAYTRFDVSAGYTHTEGRLRLEAFVNNVLNTTYMTSIINTPGLNLRFFNPPRQIGARLTVYL